MTNQPTDRAASHDPLLSSESCTLLILRDIYLSAGLSPEAALRSARADLECSFQVEISCAA